MKRLTVLVLATTLLAGCSMFHSEKEKAPLPGERVSILELQRGLSADAPAPDAAALEIPESWQNEFWPQAGGYANHAMQNPALNDGALKQAWSADIGAGSSKALPLTAQPIVAEGRIYTLDADSLAAAFSVTDGKQLWRTNVRDPREDDPVIGGGLAYAHGVIYATTGYDELLALRPADGHILWRVDLPAPSRAAPTATDERVFVTTLDNRIIALNAADGAQLWDYAGIAENAGLVGAPSPAVGRDIVVPAFSSGEIFALRIENGSIAWSDNLSSFGAQASGLGSLSAIRGLPIIDKDTVFAISFSGRMLAIDSRTGARLWQREVGSAETPWAAGNILYVISTENEMVAVSRVNGAFLWVTSLPRFRDPEDHDGPIFWTGPVMAGGRLIAASNSGDIIEASPQDGKIIRQWSAGKSVTIDPVVAGNTLYLLADDGTLMAFK